MWGAKIQRILAHPLFIRVVFIGSVLFVFGLSTATATWFYLKSQVQGLVVAMPDFYGKTEAETRQICRDFGLTLVVEPKLVASPLVERGHVLLQVPRAGNKIKSGRKVEVTFSAGAEKKLVPKLKGETQNFAATLLEDAGLKARVVARVPSATVPRGRIISQSPLPGEDTNPRLGATLLISDGPQSAYYVMPRLLRRDFLTVKRFLEEGGFRVVPKYEARDPDLGEIVLEQTPDPGYPVTKAQTINLVVNKDL